MRERERPRGVAGIKTEYVKRGEGREGRGERGGEAVEGEGGDNENKKRKMGEG